MFLAFRLFCESLSLAPRGHFFLHNGDDYKVWCFAERKHAERFRAKFGGEIIASKDRPKWPR